MVLAHLIAFAGSSVQAQVITLYGAVTDSTGIYADSVSLGDPVTLQFKITNLEDAFQGVFSPEEAAYSCDFSLLSISGVQRPLPNAYLFVLNGPTTTGIFGNHNWNSFPFADGGFSFYFESFDDIISSLDYFPPHIPMSEFAIHSGFYFTQGDGNDGTISWNITRYTGSFGQPASVNSPVPEPATYGLLASLAMFGVIAWRRMFSRKK